MIRYRVGEVSRITGFSKDTLHFYDREGIVVPDYVDPENGYRYYSRWNMWQLDVVRMCRGLDIPLHDIREIFKLRDNGKVAELLMSHYEDALQKSRYYSRVAEDIHWYEQQNKRINGIAESERAEVLMLPEETVLAGEGGEDRQSYHAKLQQVLEEKGGLASVRRRYGYVIDVAEAASGAFIKLREYIRVEGVNLSSGDDSGKLVIPGGRYAVMTAHIRNEECDLTPLFVWAEENEESFDCIFAEEEGLQLFDYLDDYFCVVKAHIKNNT